MSIDEEINRLYQLPLPEFTPARNALAGRAGRQAGDIRGLTKPNAAAWAVNQIYWRRAKTRERLETASRRLREAHAQQLAGKSADVAAAEAAHRAALSAAVADARDLLTEAGDVASPATLQSVRETLETVLWQPLDGRLSRPLKGTGLEALAALKSGALQGRGRSAEIVPFARPARPPQGQAARAEEAKRKAAERRRDAVAVARDLRAAEKAAKQADAALQRARDLVSTTERERARLTDELERATSRLAEERGQVDRARGQAERAEYERARLAERLAALEAD